MRLTLSCGILNGSLSLVREVEFHGCELQRRGIREFRERVQFREIKDPQNITNIRYMYQRLEAVTLYDFRGHVSHVPSRHA